VDSKLIPDGVRLGVSFGAAASLKISLPILPAMDLSTLAKRDLVLLVELNQAGPTEGGRCSDACQILSFHEAAQYHCLPVVPLANHHLNHRQNCVGSDLNT
jgi:hypothetical protein